MADKGQLGPSLSRATLSAIVAVGVGLAVLTAVASLSAFRSHGRPFPGLFIDPHASFSAVWWPAWGAERPPLRFPDRLVAIDGEPVAAPRARVELPAQAIAARVAALRAAGRPEVRLTFETHDGPITVVRPLRARGADEALFFFGLYALVGLFVLWSGLAVLVLARRRAGAVAYAGLERRHLRLPADVLRLSLGGLAGAAVLAVDGDGAGVRGLAGVLVPRTAARAAPSLRGAAIAFTVGGVVVAVVLAIGPYLRRWTCARCVSPSRRSCSRACWC